VHAALLITVLTMSPGGDLFARFGHTAILVEDEAGARVYNFGAYKGSDPRIVSQFLHNAIPYYLSVNPIDLFERKYRDRVITGQRLDLDDKQARALVERLEWTLRPGNRAYQYDWFRQNCTTKTRDTIDEALGGWWRAQLSGGPARHHRTIRAFLLDALYTVPSVATLFSIGLNARVDQPLDAWQELAMPADLSRALGEARRPDGRPLLAETWTWRGPAPLPADQPAWLQPLGEALLLYLLFLGALGRRVGGVGLMLWGSISLLFSLWFAFWTLVPYPDCTLSVNLFAYSPLGVVFIIDGVRLCRGRAPRWSRRAAEITVVLVLASLLSRQQHLRYALYALVASLLAWLTARAASRALPSA
jgi:hypothetical protein